MIYFIVAGPPVAQGSMKAYPRRGGRGVVVTHNSPKLKPWRTEVAWAAKEAMKSFKASLIERPTAVRVEAQFYFVRPKSVKNNRQVKSTAPDCDKLARSLLDSLSGICFRDDAQVASLVVSKWFGLQDWMSVRVTEIE